MLLTFAAGATAPAGAAIRFGDPETIATGRPRSVALVDLDADGNLDLVSAMAGGTLVLRGDGDGGFKQRRVIRQAGGVDVATGDFDGDGRQDLAALQFAGTVAVFLGRGNTFVHARDVAVPTTAIAIAAADLNGDGSIDLVTSSYGVSSLTVLLNDGDARFAIQRHETASWPLDVAIADLDRDGTPDLVTSSWQAEALSVLRGGPGGGYAFHEDYEVGAQPKALAVGDLDRDGALDVVTADRVAGTVSVLLGDGAGGFGPARAFDTQALPEAVTLADFDGDGVLDVATANWDDIRDGDVTVSGVSVLRGLGDGGFADPIELAIGRTFWSIAAGDLDGDGLPEIVASDFWTGFVVLRNESVAPVAHAANRARGGEPDAQDRAAGALGAATLRVGVRSTPAGVAVLAYALPAAANVRVRVYDVAGREVRSIDAGWRAAGAHTLAVPTHGLPGGVYFCRLHAGAHAATGKIALTR